MTLILFLEKVFELTVSNNSESSSGKLPAELGVGVEGLKAVVVVVVLLIWQPLLERAWGTGDTSSQSSPYFSSSPSLERPGGGGGGGRRRSASINRLLYPRKSEYYREDKWIISNGAEIKTIL